MRDMGGANEIKRRTKTHSQNTPEEIVRRETNQRQPCRGRQRTMDGLVKHGEQAVARERDRHDDPDSRSRIGKQQERKGEEHEHVEYEMDDAQRIVQRVVDSNGKNDALVRMLVLDRQGLQL